MMKRVFVLAALLAGLVFAAPAGAGDLPDFDTLAVGLERHEGLIRLYQDRAKGRAYLAVAASKDGRAGPVQV